MSSMIRSRMRRRTRVTGLLAALVALLAIASYVEVDRERALAPRPLIELDPAHVQVIEVSCDACRTRAFARVGGRWQMREPYALPADATAIARLLAIADAPVRERRPLREYDVGRLGLQPAQIRLRFDNRVVDFGAEDPINHDRYVHVGDVLLLVPDRFSARLLESPESELDRHPVPSGIAVERVSVHGETQRHELAVVWQDALAQGIAPVSIVIESPGSETPIAVDLANGDRIQFALRRDGEFYRLRRLEPALEYLMDEIQMQKLLGNGS